jgi:hypothetical protein
MTNLSTGEKCPCDVEKCPCDVEKCPCDAGTLFDRRDTFRDTFLAKCPCLDLRKQSNRDTRDTFPKKLRARARGKTPGRGHFAGPKISTEVTLSQKVSLVSLPIAGDPTLSTGGRLP